jgi:hypothetical protein
MVPNYKKNGTSTTTHGNETPRTEREERDKRFRKSNNLNALVFDILVYTEGVCGSNP